MKRGWLRLSLLGSMVLGMLTLLSFSYRYLMGNLEGQERSFLHSLSWASETLTSTGYGADGRWEHPLMVCFVVVSQFIGQGFLLVAFPFVVIPFFEERFELRLPRKLPRLSNFVLVYRETYPLDSLIDALEKRGVPVVVFEEDETTAKRIRDRGYRVVLGDFSSDAANMRGLKNVRAMVANASDDDNTSMVMRAREVGYQGDIYAMVASPSHTQPLVLAGATQASAPNRILAAALAAKASIKLSPPIVGLDALDQSICAAQFRIGAQSPVLGQTVAQANLRDQTGALLLAVSDPGKLVFSREPDHRLALGCVISAVGTPQALQELATLTHTGQVHLQGPILVIGYGSIGRHVAQSLRDAQEHVVVIDKEGCPGVDLVGDALEPALLKSAGIERASAVVLTLGADSSTILATALIREFSAGVPIIARVNRRDETHRIYRIGADFALSFGDVANDMLLPLILENHTEHRTALLKVRALQAAKVAGETLESAELFESVGCNVVAIRRGEELLTHLRSQDAVASGDVLYVCGEESQLAQFVHRFDSAEVRSEPSAASSMTMRSIDETALRSTSSL